jgi:hypothetical protein
VVPLTASKFRYLDQYSTVHQDVIFLGLGRSSLLKQYFVDVPENFSQRFRLNLAVVYDREELLELWERIEFVVQVVVQWA